MRLSDSQVDDIVLWEKFLDDSWEGISLNRVVCRWPTRVVRVDACPQGMGGYCLQRGLAWRIKFEPDLLGRGSLNSLEFLLALVGVMVEHQFGSTWQPCDVLLCQGDSLSATGSIARSSFGDECPLHPSYCPHVRLLPHGAQNSSLRSGLLERRIQSRTHSLVIFISPTQN